jgi:tRNA wybutosine-synthesizing protein 1
MSSSHKSGLLAMVAAVASVSAVATVWWYHKQKSAAVSKEQRDQSKSGERDGSTDQQEGPVAEIQCDDNTTENPVSRHRILTRGCITIVHGSMTGTCAKFAAALYDSIKEQQHAMVQLGTTEDYDWWDEFLNDDEESNDAAPATLIVLLPTYTSGTWPPVASNLQEALQELQNDWRIAEKPVKHKLQTAVFGTGSSEYDSVVGNTVASNMGQPAKEAVKAFQKLGAKILAKLSVGDDAVGNHAQESFDAWKAAVLKQLFKNSEGCGCGKAKTKSNTAGCCQSNGVTAEPAAGGECSRIDEEEEDDCNSDNEEDYDDDDDEFDDEEDDDDDDEPAVMDLEDMGDAVVASRQQNQSNEPREMVTPSQAIALKKEGYKLIGTHSAVKLCRWTKHQLRGRGGCYKHTFYGITSYQCMEATPSLACANKCVFCWRHHKNPVGKEWRWKTDDPYYIVDQAVRTHVQMIKETRGIPGVQLARWKEAHTVKHCALSLVGEPIMYPRIDELLGDLHRRKISTFLVTNGQHPGSIETLRPITQLYVSVDAPTETSLIAIDRPLFQDAWDRLKQSLSSLKNKGQRTVARLTVVKGWNSDEISGYAELIALGEVSLVEVKGVTFCGKSDASNLNMTNTPWHHEVVELTRTLKDELAKMRVNNSSIPEYDLACEHKHSCSVLLARVDQFTVVDAATGQRKWCTWIDYDKFQELAARNAEDPTFTFTVEDYTAETPAWALFGAKEEGFDPTDKRHRKQTKHPKYTQFDADGIPTHDENHQELPAQERERLNNMMRDRKRQIGDGSTVTELKGGEKEILDASLMFRGLVVAK